MKLTKNEWLHTGRWIGQWLIVMSLLGMALGGVTNAQAVSTTTVQGTVYLANGQVGAGTLDVSWPAFTTSNSQAITAGRVTMTIGQDGFVSVNLAPNLGATPAGLYYTAIYHMSDGTTSTEYWVVPAAAQANLGQVRAQLMPSSQAVQAVSKAYVDQSITELTQSLLTASGGTLSGPLYLNGDPTQALQAADKHYVDSAFGLAVPLAGGNMTGALATPAVNGVQAPVAGSTQTTIQAAVSAAGTSGAVEIPPTYTGSDGFTNPNGVHVTDLRQKGAQQFERSVKEFGAVCDGTTDDTNALQTALNYAQTHGVALTIPQGTCKTHMLSWRGESIGGMGKQVSALMGFPGQDVLATATDSTNLLANTRLHDLTIYVDQSMDVSCSAAEGRAPAGSCAMSRLLESNSIFSPGGNGLTGTVGTGTAWAVGNCAIAMPAATGAGGNGLRLAEIENLEIVATGTDPMAQYAGAHSTHTCGMYLAQWPQWSEFRNIDIRGLNTGIAMPALPGTTPAGLNADSNRWQNITIQAAHGFTAAAGSNNVLDNVVVSAANSAATGEPPTGLVLDLTGTQQGWTVRNAVVLPAWNVVTPTLTVTAAGGAVTAVTAGTEKGLGFDPYGTTVPLKFSGSCTAAAAANVKSDGSIGTISVTQGGVGCSGTTTASVNVDGSWDTAAPVNLIAGQNMTLFGGNLQKGNGGYTAWNAAGSRSSGTMLGGGGGTLPGGGSYTGLVANSSLGSATQVDQFPGTDFGAKLQACLGSVSATYGGTCDARNFTGNLSMASNLLVSTANVTVLLPCATISTAAQVIVTAGTRNVALRGCALRGASTASGSQGGTVFLYSGTGAMVQVGDPTYAADTMGFHLDNAVINTTASSTGTAQGLTAYRTQEMDLESLYFLGNKNQTGMTLDGTGNYTGGTFFDDAFNGFQTAVNAVGHQISNAATTDWMNASAFVRLHIVCPTSAGSPISGTYGINLQQGDGNTFTGGDVESCATALHLGANAQNNTIIGLRNENSTNQVVADAGSSYNNWMTGGTMFTGQLTDNGTRNSFMDTFHRSFNGIKGDWYGSQQDATVTNHYRIGIGTGNERGLLNRYQTDYGYRWTTGLSDATAGEQFFQVLDELNNVNRLSIGQYNNGQSSTNNQTVLNAAGTGAIVLNGSNNSGTGGVVIGSGGASESTVATINNAGNAQFNGTLQVGGPSTFIGSTTVKNQADAEIDQILWAGATANQKESYTYKDYAGSSQWYMVKDANNNWALNSATGGLDSFKAYQSANSGDTYVNTSNSSGVIRLNYESGSSGKTYIYGGSSSSLIAAFSGTTAISFPGLKSSSGYSCLQIDNSGYISNTGSACGTSSVTTNGTVSSGNAGQIAYYAANGTAISGTSAVPVTAGGTGATTTTGALTVLGAQAAVPGLSGDGQATPGIKVAGNVAASASNAVPFADVQVGSDCGAKINAALTLLASHPGTVQVSSACGTITTPINFTIPQQQLVLLPGSYTVASTITLTAHDTAIRCAGVSSESPENAYGACILQAAAGSNLSSVVSMAGFGTQLSNIVVDGNKSVVSNTSEVGIAMTGQRTVLDHVSAINSPSHGITMVGASGAVIEDTWTLHNGGSGIWANGAGDVFIRRSEFEQDCQSEINATNGSNVAWRITQSDIAGATCYSTLSGTDIPVQWWNGIDVAGSAGAWMISGTQFAENFDGLNVLSGLSYPYDAYLETIVGNSVVGNSKFLQLWSASTAYAIGDTVASANDICQSLTASNVSNTPASSPANWICASQVSAWSSGTTYTIGQVASFAGRPWTSISNSNTGNTPAIAVQGTNYHTATGLGFWVPSTLGSANGFTFHGGGSNTITGNNCFREGTSSNYCVRNEDAYVAGTFPYHNLSSTITANASQSWSGNSFGYYANDQYAANTDNYGTLPTQSAPVLANGKGLSIQNASGTAQTVVSMDSSNVVHVAGDSTKLSVLLGGNQTTGQLNLLYQPASSTYTDVVPNGVQFLLQSSSSGFGSYFQPLGTGTSTTPIYYPVNAPAVLPQPLAATAGNCVIGLSSTTAALSTATCLTTPGTYDSGTLTANLSNTVIPGMSSSPVGFYNLECYAVAINAATAGTLPLCGFYYVDADTGTLVIGATGSSKTTSAIGDNTYQAGANVRAAYIKSGTAVQGYTLSYAAGSGTALQYVVHFRVVRVGS